ncbi:unnamed protein product, partial [Iphiclides podalirius]
MTPIQVLLLTQFVWCSTAAPQQPEINDQFQTTTDDTHTETPANTATASLNQTTISKDVEMHAIRKLYNVLTVQFTRVVAAAKVQAVLRNIGTCVVNGAMELVSFYFPAPVIPLIASAAGMLIPFEPVVMLRRQMPVTSYRRAISSAVNGFLNTFDGYKLYDEDPYMTRRFNRRFMGASDEKRT